MDSVTTGEILGLILIHEQFIDDQLEFWLTVSFATIVASFAGREYMTKGNRNIVCVLYILATVVFISRWLYEGADLLTYVDVLAERGVTIQPPFLTVFARFALVGLGTLATLYFVFTNTKRDA